MIIHILIYMVSFWLLKFYRTNCYFYSFWLLWTYIYFLGDVMYKDIHIVFPFSFLFFLFNFKNYLHEMLGVCLTHILSKISNILHFFSFSNQFDKILQNVILFLNKIDFSWGKKYNFVQVRIQFLLVIRSVLLIGL